MALLRTGWTTGADFWTLSLPQILQGFAMSFFMIPLTVLSLSSVRPEETASAAGLQNFLRTIAVAVATSLALTIWGDAQRVAHNELTDTLRPDDTMAALSNAGMATEQARQVIGNLVDHESVMLAVNHTFLVTACVLFLSSALVWLSPKPAKQGGAG